MELMQHTALETDPITASVELQSMDSGVMDMA